MLKNKVNPGFKLTSHAKKFAQITTIWKKEFQGETDVMWCMIISATK